MVYRDIPLSFGRKHPLWGAFILQGDSLKISTKLLLFGSGAPAISVSPSSWDFGSTPVGTPVSKEFTIENTGTGTLEITLPITSSDPAFAITVPPPVTTLAPGESTTFTAQATAASVGTPSGNISITSNAASSPTLIAVEVTVYDAVYVATTGNDTTGDGSHANPYLTIAKANSIVNANAVLHVVIFAGTYAEAVVVPKANLTYEIVSGTVLVQPGAGVGFSLTSKDGVTIQDIEIGTCTDVFSEWQRQSAYRQSTHTHS